MTIIVKHDGWHCTPCCNIYLLLCVKVRMCCFLIAWAYSQSGGGTRNPTPAFYPAFPGGPLFPRGFFPPNCPPLIFTLDWLIGCVQRSIFSGARRSVERRRKNETCREDLSVQRGQVWRQSSRVWDVEVRSTGTHCPTARGFPLQRFCGSCLRDAVRRKCCAFAFAQEPIQWAHRHRHYQAGNVCTFIRLQNKKK